MRDGDSARDWEKLALAVRLKKRDVDEVRREGMMNQEESERTEELGSLCDYRPPNCAVRCALADRL